MVLGLVFSVAVVGVGWAVLRSLGLAKGPTALGMTPGVGLAWMAVLTSWPTLLGGHSALAGVLLALSFVVGAACVARDIPTVLEILAKGREHRVVFALVVVACAIPLLVLGTAGFVREGVPVYAADGAHHVETIQAIRSGAAWSSWYPPGLHATFAALLQLFPWVDSAAGATDASLALAVLAPLTVFGLGCALLGSLPSAVAGALLVALTIEYPYLLHYWSIWPMGAGILMALALWTIGAEYLRRQTARLAILGGLVAGAIVLTHGTEVYTSAIGLAVVAAMNLRARVDWRRLVGHTLLAAVLALVCAAPYLPSLAGWAGNGGAVAVGESWFDHTHEVESAQSTAVTIQFWLGTISSGAVIDVPLRALLLAAGVWWTIRNRRAGTLIVLCGVFAALVTMFAAVDAPAVQALFARTLPWGVPNRLAMVAVVPAALLAGAGAVDLLSGWSRVGRRLRRSGHALTWRRTSRAIGVLVVAMLVGTLALMTQLIARETADTTSYSADDALALNWLREHAAPGDVVANDGSVDAGIWAPYKAPVRILSPRLLTWAPTQTERLVRDNIADLNVPGAREAVCALGVRYVYSGIAPHDPPEPRQFPALGVLRSSPALEQAFSTPGGASVFRVNVDCDAEENS